MCHCHTTVGADNAYERRANEALETVSDPQSTSSQSTVQTTSSLETMTDHSPSSLETSNRLEHSLQTLSLQLPHPTPSRRTCNDKHHHWSWSQEGDHTKRPRTRTHRPPRTTRYMTTTPINEGRSDGDSGSIGRDRTGEQDHPSKHTSESSTTSQNARSAESETGLRIFLMDRTTHSLTLDVNQGSTSHQLMTTFAMWC